jgi:hypothetical protein
MKAELGSGSSAGELGAGGGDGSKEAPA